jgi:hypothetical protein
VPSLEEDGDAVLDDLAERFAAIVLLAFVPAAIFFFAFLASFVIEFPGRFSTVLAQNSR